MKVCLYPQILLCLPFFMGISLIYKQIDEYNRINDIALGNQAKIIGLSKKLYTNSEWQNDVTKEIKTLERNVSSNFFKIQQIQLEQMQREKLVNNTLRLIREMKQPKYFKTRKGLHGKPKSNQYQQSLCDDHDPGGKRILSFSLYGTKAETYGRFIKDIAEEASRLEIHRNFTIRIYVDHHFSKGSRSHYKDNYSRVVFCNVNNIPGYGDLSNQIETIWRFIPLADVTVDIFCPRDLDSPLLERESDAMKEWILDNKIIHVMRDRKVHSSQIMGGMWCFRNSKNRDLGIKLFNTILNQATYEFDTKSDQYILNKYIWPEVEFDSLQHDSYLCDLFPNSKPFPTKRKQFFVGCVRDCFIFMDEVCPEKCRPKDHKDWIYC